MYDKVSTIVPNLDQRNLIGRWGSEEIHSYLSDKSLDFFDPTWRYTEWFQQKSAQLEFERLARQATASIDHETIRSQLLIDVEGHAIPHAKCPNPKQMLENANWKYLAYQKFPRSVLDRLLSYKLAARVPSIHSEVLPVLIHPRLGDFVLSRLARQIASDEKIPALAETDPNLKDCLFDGELSIHQRRTELLAIILEFSIPEDFEKIPYGEYDEIRQGLNDTRKKLSLLLSELMIRFELDMESEANSFRRDLQEKIEDIGAAISTAQQNQKWRANTKLGVNVFVSAVGGAVGAIIGDLTGGIVGAAVAPVLSDYGDKLTTRLSPSDVESVEQLAAIKTDLGVRTSTLNYRRPYYHL